jgi:hypothetical protein
LDPTGPGALGPKKSAQALEPKQAGMDERPRTAIDRQAEILVKSGDFIPDQNGNTKEALQVDKDNIETFYEQTKAARSPLSNKDFYTILDIALLQERHRKLPELAEVAKAESAHKETLTKVKPEIEEELVYSLGNFAKELEAEANAEAASKTAEAVLTSVKAKLAAAIKSANADPTKSPVAEFIKSKIISPDGKAIANPDLLLHMQRKYEEHRGTEPNPYAISGKSIALHALESGATIGNKNIAQFLNENNITVEGLNVYEWMQSQYEATIPPLQKATRTHARAKEQHDFISSKTAELSENLEAAKKDFAEWTEYHKTTRAEYEKVEGQYKLAEKELVKRTEARHLAVEALSRVDESQDGYEVVKALFDTAVVDHEASQQAFKVIKEEYDDINEVYENAFRDLAASTKDFERAKAEHDQIEKATKDFEAAKATLDAAEKAHTQSKLYMQKEGIAFEYLFANPGIKVSGKPAIIWLSEKNALIDGKPALEKAIDTSLQLNGVPILKYLIDNNIPVQGEHAAIWAQSKLAQANDETTKNKYKIDNLEPLKYVFREGFIKPDARPEARKAAINLCREGFIDGKFAIENAIEQGIQIDGKPILEYFVENNLNILHEPAAVWAQRKFAITGEEKYKVNGMEPLEYVVLKGIKAGGEKEKAAIDLFRNAVVKKRIPCNGTKVVMALQEKFDNAHIKSNHTFIPVYAGSTVFTPPLLEVLRFDNVTIDPEMSGKITDTLRGFVGTLERSTPDYLQTEEFGSVRDNVLKWTVINIPLELIARDAAEEVIEIYAELSSKGNSAHTQPSESSEVPSSLKLVEISRKIQSLELQRQDAFKKASEDAAAKEEGIRQQLLKKRQEIQAEMLKLDDQIDELATKGEDAETESDKITQQLEEIKQLKSKLPGIKDAILKELEMQVQALNHERTGVEFTTVSPTGFIDKVGAGIKRVTKTDALGLLDRKIQHKKEQIAAIKSDIDKFEITEADHDGTSLKKLWQELRDYRRGLANYKKESELEARIDELDTQMVQIQSDINDLQVQIGKEDLIKGVKKRGLALQLQNATLDEQELAGRTYKELHRMPLYSLDDEGKPSDQKIPLGVQIAALERQIDLIYAEAMAEARAEQISNRQIDIKVALGKMTPIDYMIRLVRIQDGLVAVPTNEENEPFAAFSQARLQKPALIDEVDPRVYAVIKRHITIDAFLTSINFPSAPKKADFKALGDGLSKTKIPEDKLTTYGLEAFRNKVHDAKFDIDLSAISQEMINVKAEYTTTMRDLSSATKELEAMEAQLKKAGGAKVGTLEFTRLQEKYKVQYNEKYKEVEELKKTKTNLEKRTDALQAEKNSI